MAAASNGNVGTRAQGPRCIALVGPFQAARPRSSKRYLARTGAIQRQGTVEAGTSVGDASKEARHHKMSVELTVATTTFMDDSYTFIDCPGSVEFIHDMRAALPAVDAAVVVCEADEKKMPQLQLIMRELEELEYSALPVPQQDRQGRNQGDGGAGDPAAGVAQAPGDAPASDPARTTSSPASSISRSSASMSTRSTRRPRSFRSRARTSTAPRMRASPCWRSWPITTTS